ncbi:MAG: NAD(P)-binding domain-containing protein [Myxococcota bacterium]
MSMEDLPVGVLGGGGFGRGLARATARNGREVVLWSRSHDASNGAIRTTRELADLARCEVIFVAVPSIYVAEVAGQLGEHLDGSHLLVHVSRGLVGEDLQTVSQVLRHETPCRRVGALAGPLVASALAEGQPGGGVVGTRFPEVAEAVRNAIAGPALRIYETRDVTGVEVASAIVGLLCLAVGYTQAGGMGPGTLAVVVTRGIAEAARVGQALGAQQTTFGGLAGFGDLIAAVAGDDRPETRLGRAMAEGASRESAAHQVGAHIEGVSIARRVANYAASVGLEVPIAETIADVLDGRIGSEGATQRLMARRVRME